MKTAPLLVITVIIIPLVIGYLFLRFYFSAGLFDRDRMNAVVNEVRHQPIEPGQTVQFQFDDFAVPSVFRAVKNDDAKSARNVWARRTAEGLWQVAIMTKDRGHFGEYGFTYSDVPLNPTTEDGNTYLGVPGQMRSLAKKVDDHWWKVVNRER